MSLRLVARRLGPAALLVGATLLAGATHIGAASWGLPIIGYAERALHDLRIRGQVHHVPARGDILLALYDEETARETRARSPVDRAMIADALAALDRAGATAIGVDVLLDQVVDEATHAELLDRLAAMRTPVVLGTIGPAADGETSLLEPWQEETLRSVFDALAGTQVAPGDVLLSADSDSVIRRAPTARDGFAQQLARLAGVASPPSGGYLPFHRGETGDHPFISAPLHLLARLPDAGLERIAGDRVVLIGALLKGVDRHVVAGARRGGETTPGVVIHAHALAQMLDGRHAQAPSTAARYGLALVVVVAGAAIGAAAAAPLLRLALALIAFAAPVGVATAVQSVEAHAGAPFPLAGLWIALIVALAVGSAGRTAVKTEERRFISTALKLYVPASVVRDLERRPESLSLSGETKEIAALFSDIEGFTALSTKVPPQRLRELLQAYFEEIAGVVHDHGGTLDKFIGDAVVAFWGAPIATPDAADRAVACAVAIEARGRAYAEARKAEGVDFGPTRVGVHMGPAVVGNFGSSKRYQYTAIGDAMNTAARLESANKETGTRVLVSGAAAGACRRTRLRPLGWLALRGRDVPVAVWEPAATLAEDALRAQVFAAERLAHDWVDGVRALRNLTRANPEDRALARWLERVERREWT